uniref:unspecific monooxygenase n=1 Tax=Streltzoviella insularis TaxID=1206366 RepID=A0A7D5YVY0_9NEOP|nr:cytochrome P450 39 [Streltzoviella insularis]
MIIEIIIFLVTSIVAYSLYSYKKYHNYFKQRDVKYLPGIPIFGNAFKSTFLFKHLWEDIDEIYRAFPNEKYVGYIEGMTPIIVVRDPDLIKSITVKDFDHFTDHRHFFTEETEPLFGGSLLMMRGERWRDMRTTLSPAFTGSKMKLMMPFMTEVSNNIINYLKEHQGEDIDAADLMRRYTNDVIASAAFGLQVDSLKDKDNEFYTIGQTLLNFTGTQRLIMYIYEVFPQLGKVLGLKFFPDRTVNFFREIVTSTMEYREKNKVERPDMIHLLMQASKGNLKQNSADSTEKDVGFAIAEDITNTQGKIRDWSLTELTGQAFAFFAAGFETSSTILTMCSHELAINPDVQEKLYQEIKEFKERNSTLTFENVGQLKYLDCVLNETFRKWSPALIMDRVCTKPYELPPPKEGSKPYRIKPGDIIYNSVNSIHLDPKYYPQPKTFDPERFSEENRHKLKPFTFMPFGIGPRNCIGSRFALLEIKVFLYNLILNYKILKCKQTTDPIELMPGDFNVKAKGGSWIKLEARSSI